MNEFAGKIDAIEKVIKSGRLNEAEDLCRSLLGGQPNPEERSKVAILLSKILIQSEKAHQALAILKEMLEYSQTHRQPQIEAQTYQCMSMAYRILADFGKSLEYTKKALAWGEKNSDDSIILPALNDLAILHSSIGEYFQGLEYFFKILDKLQQQGNIEGAAKILSNIGQVYSKIGEYAKSIEYYQQALSIHKEKRNTLQVAKEIRSIAKIYVHTGEYLQALEYHYRALEIEENIKNTTGILDSLGAIGILQLYLGETTRALDYFGKALAYSEELGNTHSIATHICNIGNAYQELENYSLALEHYIRSYQLFESVGDKLSMAHLLCSIGNIYIVTSQYERVEEYIERSLLLAQEIGAKGIIASDYGMLGLLYSKEDFGGYTPQQAELYLLESCAMYEEIGNKKNLAQVYQYLSSVYEQTDRPSQALSYWKKFYELDKELKNDTNKKLVNKYAFEQQIAVMEKEKEITDMLLHKFLPSPIVPEVKEREGKLMVRKYDSLSILFADIVGFTELSLCISPEDLVNLLNYIFTLFDTIIKEAGGHRLRTIGDGYFAVCGAPDVVEEHQYRLAKAAIAMHEALALPDSIATFLPPGTTLSLRIGLHCGEAVCGLIGGLEKWQYDIYGDTVNTASRMESYGEAGKTHCSTEFKNALEGYEEFFFEQREPITVKGKGVMQTYFFQKV